MTREPGRDWSERDTAPLYQLPERYEALHEAAAGAPHHQQPRRLPRPHHHRRRHWINRTWLRRTIKTALGCVTVLALLVATSVIGALRTPGNEDFQAKWADWLRSHHMEGLVTPLENWYFEHQQPAKGGRPSTLNSIPPPDPNTPTALPPPGTAHATHLPPPTDLPLIVQPGLPGEGHWQPTGFTPNGVPGMYVAQFRADRVYTREITTAVWIDPTVVRLALVPGTREPGGHWPQPPYVKGPDARRRILAAYNGGFRFDDAKGGIYLDGTAPVPLVNGAASIAITRTGTIALGAWGHEVHLGPNTAEVLQNLTLLIDHGVIDPAIQHNDTSSWGATVKGRIVVPRSGLGITANGALIYVAGPALSASTLAESLRRAGAVRAMTLDLNTEWVTFNLYQHPNPSDPTQVTATKLYPQMYRPADRYLTPDSRDFFTISLP